MVGKLKLLFAGVVLTALGVAAALSFPAGGKFTNLPCRGSIYYVDGTVGNDSNCGNSPTYPWKTITKVNSSVAGLSANSTISFQGGQTFSGGVILTGNVGPITVNSYAIGKAASAATISSGNSAGCIRAQNVPNVTINNIICIGGGATTNTTNGISIENSGVSQIAGPTITNSTVSGYGRGCIVVGTTSGNAGFNNIAINQNTAHDCTQNEPITNSGLGIACIEIQNTPVGVGNRTKNSNAHINNNTVFNCLGTTGVTAQPTGFGIIMATTTTGTINNNLVHDNGVNSSTGAGPTGIITVGADGITIQFNEVYNTKTDSGAGGGDGEGIDFDAATINSIAQYNFVHDNTTAELLAGDFSAGVNNNNTFRFNTVHPTTASDNGAQIAVGSTNVTNLNIYNNTIVLESAGTSYCIFGSNPTPNTFSLNISNNICYALNAKSAEINIQSATLALTGNDYFSDSGSFPVFTPDGGTTTYTTLTAMHAAGFEKVGATPVGTIANPSLVDTFPAAACGGYSTTCPPSTVLLTGSAMASPAGQNLNTVYGFNVGTQDYYGTAVTASTLPIGASATVSSVYQGPGDIVATKAYAWWGLRCYSSTSTGSIADVWDAATGNTTETLLTCGTGGVINQTVNTLATTCASSCVVKTLYDQSGNSNCSGPCDATQATNSKRPVLTQNCNGTTLCATFTAASSQVLASANTSASHAQPISSSNVSITSLTSGVDYFGHNAAGVQLGYNSSSANTAFAYAGGGLVPSATATDSATHALNINIGGGGNASINVDGTYTVAAINANGIASGAALVIGQDSLGGSSFQGNIMEFGIWPLGFTGNQQTGLCHNQSRYYGLSLAC